MAMVKELGPAHILSEHSLTATVKKDMSIDRYLDLVKELSAQSWVYVVKIHLSHYHPQGANSCECGECVQNMPAGLDATAEQQFIADCLTCAGLSEVWYNGSFFEVRSSDHYFLDQRVVGTCTSTAFLVGLWLVWAIVESLSLMHAGDFQRRLLQQVAHLSFNLVAHKHKAPFLSSLQDGNASTKCKSCIEVRALIQVHQLALFLAYNI